MTAFFSVSFGRGSVFMLCDPLWPRPLNVILFTWSSSASWQRLSMSSGSNGLHWGAISQQAGRVFSHGVLSKAPANARPPSFPKFIRAHDIMARPPIRLASVLLLQLFSHPLTALKKKDTSTCLLWKSLWPHINARPQLSDGRRGRANPSKPYRATSALSGCAYLAAGQAASALHLMAVLQVFRPRCSPMRKPVWIHPLSGTWGARQTWF